MSRRELAKLACATCCDTIGMNYCDRGDGWDDEVIRLAEAALFDQHDILGRPSRVGRGIVAMLDDMVRNP